jgi:hypothetical protein
MTCLLARLVAGRQWNSRSAKRFAAEGAVVFGKACERVEAARLALSVRPI